jgi:hypothetical protein
MKMINREVDGVSVGGAGRVGTGTHGGKGSVGSDLSRDF